MKTPITTAIALTLLACNPDTSDPDRVVIQGSITDTQGAQSRFAGTGSVEAAASVQAKIRTDDGSWIPIGTVPIEANGRYSVAASVLPYEFVRIDAADTSGAVIGSVMVEPGEGDRIATPISTETSIEAAMYDTVGADGTLWADIRARIDADAAELLAESDTREEQMADMADALVAGASARVRAWQEAGLDVATLDQARLDAAARLSTELDAGTGGYPAYLESLAQAELSSGATEEEMVQTHASASIAFRSTLEAHDATALLDVTADESARIEGEAWVVATASFMEALGAAQPQIDQAQSLTTDLTVELREADTQAEVDAAIEAWREGLIGGDEGLGVVGLVVGLDTVTKPIFDGAVSVATDAALLTDQAIQAQADAAVMTGDYASFGSSVTTTLASERTALRSDLTTLLAANSSLTATVDLLVTANTTFVGQ